MAKKKKKVAKKKVVKRKAVKKKKPVKKKKVAAPEVETLDLDDGQPFDEDGDLNDGTVGPSAEEAQQELDFENENDEGYF